MMIVVVFAAGCVTLDSFLYNPIHCTAVSDETCLGPEEPFDRVCVPCEEPYDWGREYPWPAGTLAEGQSVRPVASGAVEPISIASDDGLATLDAYFLTSHGEDPLLADVTVVYNHGRFAGIEHYQPRVRVLHEAGYNVFVWDYRGFGKSDPAEVPTPDQQLADARLALQVAQQRAPNAARVIPYGYSAGAVAATEMALDPDVCALILEAPFTSLSRITESGTRLSLGEQFFSTGQYDNFLRMEQFDGPVFGMIGTLDETVPGVESAGELVEAGTGPSELWVVEGASHGIGGGGIPEDAGLAEYFAQLTDFVTARCP